MARLKSTGKCLICGKSFSKSGISRHLQSCRKKGRACGSCISSGGGFIGKGFHLAVEGKYFPGYWLRLDVAATMPLGALDHFLREIWLECCGHLSAFYIRGGEYSARSRVTAGRVFLPGMQFTHEYDFGDTTELTLRVVSEDDVNVGLEGIRVLARNDPPALACAGCGAIATGICTECVWEGEGLLCDGCAARHSCDEEMMLPVVNSPRAGQCAYTGE